MRDPSRENSPVMCLARHGVSQLARLRQYATLDDGANERAIAILKGEKPPPLMEVSVKLDFLDLSPKTGNRENGAYIPYHYIEDENLRLRLYQRLSALSTRKEISLIKQEIADRFGKLPAEVQRLLLIAELRIAAADRGIKSIVVRNRQAMLASGNDFLQNGGRHPRLDAEGATALLRELIQTVADSGGKRA